MKDGKPGTLKDSFIRRLTGFFQPLDLIWGFGRKRQRIGDKFAETVVVKLEEEWEEASDTEETEDAEKVLEDVLLGMKNQLAQAKLKVDASIGIETQFRNAYEGALAQVKQCEERATIAIQAGREEFAREDLAQRNEHRRLAHEYKTQWEEQKQVVQHLRTLLETLEQKTAETQRKQDVIIAQHRNIDAQEHLRQMLRELQDNPALENLEQLEQDAVEATLLAKAATAADLDFQTERRNQEFIDAADEASIDKEIAEIKATLQ